jgi:hypothetical protein
MAEGPGGAIQNLLCRALKTRKPGAEDWVPNSAWLPEGSPKSLRWVWAGRESNPHRFRGALQFGRRRFAVVRRGSLEYESPLGDRRLFASVRPSSP